MKVKDLLENIERSKQSYPDFLDWDIALEHVDKPEEDINCKDDIITHIDNDIEWKFIKSHAMGCCSYFTKEKVFGIQIHF